MNKDQGPVGYILYLQVIFKARAIACFQAVPPFRDTGAAAPVTPPGKFDRVTKEVIILP